MENGVKYLLAAFITIILGVALLGVYSDVSNTRTQLSVKTENISIASARIAAGVNSSVPLSVANGYNTWRSDYASDCLKSDLVSYKNNTGSAFTVTTDYTYNPLNGTIYLVNTDLVNNTGSNNTVVSYYYCQDGYLPSGFGQSMQKITVGLLAVMLLVAAGGFMYMAMKDMKQ